MVTQSHEEIITALKERYAIRNAFVRLKRSFEDLVKLFDLYGLHYSIHGELEVHIEKGKLQRLCRVLGTELHTIKKSYEFYPIELYTYVEGIKVYALTEDETHAGQTQMSSNEAEQEALESEQMHTTTDSVLPNRGASSNTDSTISHEGYNVEESEHER